MNCEELTQLIGELEDEDVLEKIKDFVETSPTDEEGRKVLEACQAGMVIVGQKFEEGEFFVGDLVFAGNLLGEAIDLLKPVISNAASTKVGTIVLGTVSGDLHDIGKNIFKSLVDAAGFEVYDLGIDVPASTFVEKVKEINPDIVGMSGILTLALDSMKETVSALKAAGVRDQLKVIIGGNPVNEIVCSEVGADAFTTNAAEGVKICQKWVSAQ